MVFLALWEAPLATAPVTLYLGQSLFSDKAEPRKTARNLVASLPQLTLYQVLAAGADAPVGGHLVRALCRPALSQRGHPAGAKSASSAAAPGA